MKAYADITWHRLLQRKGIRLGCSQQICNSLEQLLNIREEREELVKSCPVRPDMAGVKRENHQSMRLGVQLGRGEEESRQNTRLAVQS